MNVGDNAPEFSLKDQTGTEIRLQDFRRKFVVVYFYPKDNTSGCTIEAIEFSKYKTEFEKNNAIILGISSDSPESHKKFIKDKKLTVVLLSDSGSDVQKKYGVWRQKPEGVGTVRSTFLLDTTGKILKIWDPVEPKGHAEEVLDEVKKINQKEHP